MGTWKIEPEFSLAKKTICLFLSRWVDKNTVNVISCSMHLYIVLLLSFLVEWDFTRPRAAFWWISLAENSFPHLVIWGTSSQKPVPFCFYSLNASSQIVYLDFILEDVCVSGAFCVRVKVYVCMWVGVSVCVYLFGSAHLELIGYL